MFRTICTSIMLFFSAAAVAQIKVPIVWPFNPGSTQSNYVRLIIQEANKSQSKYQFYFEHKPGAGGTVAMNFVDKYDGVALAVNSSSLFTRPLFYPAESYDIKSFSPIISMCTNQPVVISSAKFDSLENLRSQSRITVGVAYGSITQAVAEQLRRNLPGVEVVLVGYVGTPEITKDVAAGILDLGVDFARDLLPWIKDNKVRVIGATGTNQIKEMPNFRQQGGKGFDPIVQNYFVVSRDNVDDGIKKELHTILHKANQSAALIQLYHEDYCSPSNLDYADTRLFYQKAKSLWPPILKDAQVPKSK